MKIARKVKINKISKVVTYILLLCIVIVFVGFLAYSTDNFTSSFKTFHIEYEDEKIFSNRENIRLLHDEKAEFKVVYTLGFLGDNDYVIKIVPGVTEETNFRFTVGDENVWFSEIADFTDVFNVEKSESSFTLNPGSMEDVLQRLYPNQIVELPELDDCDYFSLYILSADESVGIRLKFHLYVPVTDISLDTTEVLFW